MNVIFGILTCERDRPNESAIYDTWLDSAGMDWMFFPTPDSYEELPKKVQKMCVEAIRQDYDFLFKCDVDTYVRPERLKLEGDYTGFVLTGETYCSGGAGYLLSRKACEIVAGATVDDTVEDRWVGKVLAQAGITPLHSRSFMPWRVPITKSNDVISVHLSKNGHVYDPAWMREVHREWELSE